MMTILFILLVAFLAALTQSATGFGSALVAMALLPIWISLRIASPLVALWAATIEVLLLIRYRASIRLRAIGLLAAGMAFGVPFGILVLRRVPEAITVPILGGVIAAYAGYALLTPRLPRLERSQWAGAFGFAAGLLGGAYNTSGPPLVVYGHARGWAPAEFKANLQGVFLLSDLLVILGHAIAGNLTGIVLWDYGLGLPTLLAGLAIGFRLDRHISPTLFRRLVLVLLLVLGVGLILR